MKTRIGEKLQNTENVGYASNVGGPRYIEI